MANERTITYDFQEKGVRIEVLEPDTKAFKPRDIKIRVNPTPKPIDAFKSMNNQFTPHRIVIYFDVFKDKTEDEAKKIEAKLSLRVAFTKKDLDSIPDGNINIAYWNGEDWLPFEISDRVNYVQSQFWMLDDSDVVGEFNITHTFDGDPPIALGS